MRTLRVGFVDFIPSLEKYFTNILSKWYDIERDDSSPNFLFFSTEDFGTNNKKFDNLEVHWKDTPYGDIGKVVKILFTGENKRPEAYTCDYAISFDHNYAPWNYRLPLYVIDQWCIPYDSGIMEYPYEYILTAHQKSEINQREFFCGFVHRNPSNSIRNAAFIELSKKYKPVTSAGPLLNNYPIVQGIKGKIDFFRQCKFALCFENSANPGYVTEKILHAFYAGAIPIYWGSATIEKDFNPASFIDAGKCQSFEEMIDKIREVDESPAIYQRMLAATKVPAGLPNECMNPFTFLNWFDANVYRGRNKR